MTTILVAGGTGTLGSRIARNLLKQEGVVVRILVRDPANADAAKSAVIDSLVTEGAVVAAGDLNDPTSLDAATKGVDVVVSAVQGGREIIVDGQISLAGAAVRSGVRRFLPSDFALNLFLAPNGAPQFDLRKEAGEAIDAMNLEVVHVLNGAFMEMLDPASPGIIDVSSRTARVWGTGDERFNLTTLDDTARFTAKMATDPGDVKGIRMVSGAETSFNAIIAETERLTGAAFTTNFLGDIDDLRRITSTADNPWSVVMQWYLLSMLTVPPFETTENNRYPDLELTGLNEYLNAAHESNQRD